MLVEAAIIVPIIVLLTFGAIEFGFAFNEQGTTRSATRTAARAASTQSKQSAAALEAAAVDTLNASAGNLATGQPVEAWVYRAVDVNPVDGVYERPAGNCTSTAATADCARYTWDAPNNRFIPAGGDPWTPQERVACAGSTSRVGVYLVVSHNWLTGLPLNGNDGVTLTSNTIMALEPAPPQICLLGLP